MIGRLLLRILPLRVTLIVEPEQIRAVGTRGDLTIWDVSATIDPTAPVASAVATFVRTLPRAAGPRLLATQVRVQLGGALAHVRTIEGLPPVKEVAVLTSILRQNISRFFVGRPDGLLISNAVLSADGTVVAAAFARATVEEIVSALRACGCDPVAVSAGSDARLSAPVQKRAARRISRIRTTVAWSALVFSLLMLAVLPVLVSSHRLSSARETLDRLRATQLTAVALQDSVTYVSRLLSVAAKEGSPPRSSLLVLAAVAASLPDSAMLLSFHMDSASGNLILLGPRLGTFMRALAAIPSIESPALVGPVTREDVDGASLERASVRFSRGSQ
ncbi:MAG: hypothetical protein ACYC2K_12495 [Gemmatimonadales bacterium]